MESTHVSFNHINKIWDIMAKCPQHTFLILTKRVERMKLFLTEDLNCKLSLPLPNVYLGITAENQQRADERIPILLQIPAAKHFVSLEPILGSMDINPYFFWEWTLRGHDHTTEKTTGLDWVICAPETGPKRRPYNLRWIRDIKNQCVDAGIPFFLKHLFKGTSKISLPQLDGKVWNERPE